ncbi:hypothetical protein PsorP6_019412 [Peronosclerospora sorghi]|nr:hypothetical protein PsorP6_019412 [Peronosclerospora sorghi]
MEDDTSTSALKKKEALDLNAHLEKENVRLREELAQIQESNRQVGAAPKQLEATISTLFATEQLELCCKDNEIQQLHTE